jgi:rhodanese-related sulfurtransferase
VDVAATARIMRRDSLLDDVRGALPHRPTPAELSDYRARGALIVDIRTTEQRTRDGALPGAIVIDRTVLEWRLDPTSAHRVPEATGDDREIVVVCNEGFSSSLAAASLQALGLRRATDLDGGFMALLAFGSHQHSVDRGAHADDSSG